MSHVAPIGMERLGVVLEPASGFDQNGALNPAVVQHDDSTDLYYRAVDGDNVSTVGFAKLDLDNKVLERAERPVFSPGAPYEQGGVEDPRISLIDGTYYLVYTAYDGSDAAIAYATSPDLKEFTRGGIISPDFQIDDLRRLRGKELSQELAIFDHHVRKHHPTAAKLWDKDGVLFPEKIGGKFALLHRIMPETQLALFENFTEPTGKSYWDAIMGDLAGSVVNPNTEWYEVVKNGAGAPPLRTADGWLVITHGIRELGDGLQYSMSAILLDADDPTTLIGKLKDPLLMPEEPYEQSGAVNQVVFPTGFRVDDDRMTIYYGAADSVVAAVRLSLSELLAALRAAGAPQ